MGERDSVNQHSSAQPFISCCGAIALLVGASFLYQFVVRAGVPVVSTIALALVCGSLGRFIVTTLRVKDESSVLLVAVTVTFVALFTSHLTEYVIFDGKEGAVTVNRSHHLSAPEYLALKLKVGWVYSQGGIPTRFADRAVLLIWALEAMLILGVTIIHTWSATRRAFCFECAEWIDDVRVVWRRPILHERTLREIKKAKLTRDLLKQVGARDRELLFASKQTILGWLDYSLCRCNVCSDGTYARVEWVQLPPLRNEKHSYQEKLFLSLVGLVFRKQSIDEERTLICQDRDLTTEETALLLQRGEEFSLSEEEARARSARIKDPEWTTDALWVFIALLTVGVFLATHW